MPEMRSGNRRSRKSDGSWPPEWSALVRWCTLVIFGILWSWIQIGLLSLSRNVCPALWQPSGSPLARAWLWQWQSWSPQDVPWREEPWGSQMLSILGRRITPFKRQIPGPRIIVIWSILMESYSSCRLPAWWPRYTVVPGVVGSPMVRSELGNIEWNSINKNQQGPCRLMHSYCNHSDPNTKIMKELFCWQLDITLA